MEAYTQSPAARDERAGRPDAAGAVGALYEGHAVGFIRLAVVMLGDRAAAEDVVQELDGDPRRRGESRRRHQRVLGLQRAVRRAHGGSCRYCVRLLDTDSHASTVRAASRIIVRPPRIRSLWLDWNTTMLSPDGRRVLRSVTICEPTSRYRCHGVTRGYGYSARSGRQLLALSSRGNTVQDDVVWLSPGGTRFVFTTLTRAHWPYIAAYRYTPGPLLWSMPLPPHTVAVTW